MKLKSLSWKLRLFSTLLCAVLTVSFNFAFIRCAVKEALSRSRPSTTIVLMAACVLFALFDLLILLDKSSSEIAGAIAGIILYPQAGVAVFRIYLFANAGSPPLWASIVTAVLAALSLISVALFFNKRMSDRIEDTSSRFIISRRLSEESLMKLAANEKASKRDRIEAIKRIRSTVRLEALLDTLSDADPSLISVILSQISQSDSSSRIALKRMTRHNDPTIRSCAVRLIDDDEKKDLAIHDSSADVRSAAILSLKDSRFLSDRLFVNEPDEVVCRHTLCMLKKLGVDPTEDPSLTAFAARTAKKLREDPDCKDAGKLQLMYRELCCAPVNEQLTILSADHPQEVSHGCYD